MAILDSAEKAFLRGVAKLVYCNPFLPVRIEYERETLGAEFREVPPVWSMQVGAPDYSDINVINITKRLEVLVNDLRGRLTAAGGAPEVELDLYESAVLFLLYHRYEDRLYAVVEERLAHKPVRESIDFFTEFLKDWRHYFHIPDVAWRTRRDATHLFACFFQLRRAFHLIFRYIIGSSKPAARVRAAAWQSIFTHDMQRYLDSLYARMGDLTTLITGPSGTGKELIARAIGLSRYIPFNAGRKSFAGDFAVCFHALNLSAVPSTLVESELFGHRRGAFTGALQDRRGWLEICEQWGTVFLDEVGDLDAAIQVKLLRVLQSRTFQPLGDTTDKLFQGKVIAATNRDLGLAMRSGKIREDFYYRLCSDVLTTPSLQEQLRESPQVLRELIHFIAQGLAGPDAQALADEVEEWIAKTLGPDYPWPGNFRELEQCVRNVLVRSEYRPPPAGTDGDELVGPLTRSGLTAEELLRRYCTLVYARTGSYEETARRLQLDRRTIKSRIDMPLLAQLRQGKRND